MVSNQALSPAAFTAFGEQQAEQKRVTQQIAESEMAQYAEQSVTVPVDSAGNTVTLSFDGTFDAAHFRHAVHRARAGSARLGGTGLTPEKEEELRFLQAYAQHHGQIEAAQSVGEMIDRGQTYDTRPALAFAAAGVAAGITAPLWLPYAMPYVTGGMAAKTAVIQGGLGGGIHALGAAVAPAYEDGEKVEGWFDPSWADIGRGLKAVPQGVAEGLLIGRLGGGFTAGAGSLSRTFAPTGTGQLASNLYGQLPRRLQHLAPHAGKTTIDTGAEATLVTGRSLGEDLIKGRDLRMDRGDLYEILLGSGANVGLDLGRAGARSIPGVRDLPQIMQGVVTRQVPASVAFQQKPDRLPVGLFATNKPKEQLWQEARDYVIQDLDKLRINHPAHYQEIVNYYGGRPTADQLLRTYRAERAINQNVDFVAAMEARRDVSFGLLGHSGGSARIPDSTLVVERPTSPFFLQRPENVALHATARAGDWLDPDTTIGYMKGKAPSNIGQFNTAGSAITDVLSRPYDARFRTKDTFSAILEQQVNPSRLIQTPKLSVQGSPGTLDLKTVANLPRQGRIIQDINAEPTPGKRHRGTLLLSDPEGRILLVKGKGDPLWSLPGGGIDAGETALQAASREVREETGYQASNLQEAFDYDGPTSYHSVIKGNVENPNIQAQLQAKEIEDIKWWDGEETMDLMPSVRDVLEAHTGRRPTGRPETPNQAIRYRDTLDWWPGTRKKPGTYDLIELELQQAIGEPVGPFDYSRSVGIVGAPSAPDARYIPQRGAPDITRGQIGRASLRHLAEELKLRPKSELRIRDVETGEVLPVQNYVANQRLELAAKAGQGDQVAAKELETLKRIDDSDVDDIADLREVRENIEHLKVRISTGDGTASAELQEYIDSLQDRIRTGESMADLNARFSGRRPLEPGPLGLGSAVPRSPVEDEPRVEQQGAAAPALRMPTPEGPDAPALRVPTPEGPDVPALRMPTPEGPDVPALRVPPPEGPDVPALRVPPPEGPDVPALRVPTPEGPDVPALRVPPSDVPEGLELRVPPPDLPEQLDLRVPPPDLPDDIPGRRPPPDLPDDIPGRLPPPDFPDDIPGRLPPPLPPPPPPTETPPARLRSDRRPDDGQPLEQEQLEEEQEGQGPQPQVVRWESNNLNELDLRTRRLTSRPLSGVNEETLEVTQRGKEAPEERQQLAANLYLELEDRDNDGQLDLTAEGVARRTRSGEKPQRADEPVRPGVDTLVSRGADGSLVAHELTSTEPGQDDAQGAAFDEAMDRAEAAARSGDTAAQAAAEEDVAQALAGQSAGGEVDAFTGEPVEPAPQLSLRERLAAGASRASRTAAGARDRTAAGLDGVATALTDYQQGQQQGLAERLAAQEARKKAAQAAAKKKKERGQRGSAANAATGFASLAERLRGIGQAQPEEEPAQGGPAGPAPNRSLAERLGRAAASFSQPAQPRRRGGDRNFKSGRGRRQDNRKGKGGAPRAPCCF